MHADRAGTTIGQYVPKPAWFAILAVVCLALVTSTQARADVFKQLTEIRHGAKLFHQDRYQDTVDVFEPIFESLSAEEPRDLHRTLTVVNFLAQSHSFLGNDVRALVLMQERVSVARELHGENSSEFAATLAGLAEAYYRSGDVQKAKRYVDEAISGLSVHDEEGEYLELAKQNLKKYSKGPFDDSQLPTDLSNFYSRCESIKPGDNEFSVDRAMTQFVELDVDYKPEGFWGAMFEVAAQGPDGKARQGDNYRRIFLPSTNEELHQELCVVDQRSGVVVNADNSLD